MTTATCAISPEEKMEYKEITDEIFQKMEKINPVEIWQEISGTSFEESIAFMLWVVLKSNYNHLVYICADLPKNSFSEVFAVHKLAEYFTENNGKINTKKMSAVSGIPTEKISRHLGKNKVINYDFQAFHYFYEAPEHSIEKYAFFLLWLKMRYSKMPTREMRFHMKKRNFWDVVSFVYWIGTTGTDCNYIERTVAAMPPSLCKTIGEKILSEYC